MAREWTRKFAQPISNTRCLWTPAPEVQIRFDPAFRRLARCVYILHRRLTHADENRGNWFSRLNKSLINLILCFAAPPPREFRLWELTAAHSNLSSFSDCLFDVDAKDWRRYFPLPSPTPADAIATSPAAIQSEPAATVPPAQSADDAAQTSASAALAQLRLAFGVKECCLFVKSAA